MSKVLSLLLAFLVCTGAAAQISPQKPGGSSVGPVVQTEQVRAELVAIAPDGVGPGKTVWAGLQITHQPQWHTYWKNPGDSGLPTQLQWNLPAGISAGEIAWPAPKKIPIGSLANFGFEDTVLLPVPLTVAGSFRPPLTGDSVTLQLHASWLVCKLECVPQEGDFALALPIRTSTALATAAFESAWAAAPKPFKGTASVRVEGNALVLSARNLPAAWVGKSLNVVPETPEIIENARAPETRDAVARSDTAAAANAGQVWSNAGEPVWSVRIPYSALRSESPTSLGFVLARDGLSLQTVAAVEGSWPPVAAPPGGGVSPALQAALDSNARPPTTALSGSLLLALLSALLGGLVLNLMPCVFPVLAIKVLAFAAQRDMSRASHRAQGLAYTAGVVASFMALGGLMLALRAGGEQLGWGFQLQSPGVIAALALLFTLLGLNLMGLLQVGNLLPGNLASVQLRHPAGDAFLSGVLAVAIASPCTAPFMGASLGYAISLPGVQAMAIFAALGIGLALPYLLASWVPALARCLPRPGAWMETLRRFMAFPMWATVVWLLWVLGHLSGVDGAASLLAILLAVALLAWALNQAGRSRTVLAGVALAVCALLVAAIGPNVLKFEEGAASGTATTWQAWAPGRVEAELAAGKPVFIDFTAAWCITCQYNKKTTLSHPEVLAAFGARNVTLLRADWTRRDPAITEALGRLGRSGVPVYVLYQSGKAPVVMSEILSVGELRSALESMPAKS